MTLRDKIDKIVHDAQDSHIIDKKHMPSQGIATNLVLKEFADVVEGMEVPIMNRVIDSYNIDSGVFLKSHREIAKEIIKQILKEIK